MMIFFLGFLSPPASCYSHYVYWDFHVVTRVDKHRLYNVFNREILSTLTFYDIYKFSVIWKKFSNNTQSSSAQHSGRVECVFWKYFILNRRPSRLFFRVFPSILQQVSSYPVESSWSRSIIAAAAAGQAKNPIWNDKLFKAVIIFHAQLALS